MRTALADANVATSLDVNGVSIASHDAHPAQPTVGSLELRAQTLNWRSTLTESTSEVAIATLAVLIALLPLDLENRNSTDKKYDGELEGAKRTGIFSRYERSRANRAIAILIHGTRCSVCGLDFGERYKGIGGGYIEIHHLLPVHLMVEPAIVNPRTDLVPLCSNCHRMAHRVDPPHTPDALRASLHDSPQGIWVPISKARC